MKVPVSTYTSVLSIHASDQTVFAFLFANVSTSLSIYKKTRARTTHACIQEDRKIRREILSVQRSQIFTPKPKPKPNASAVCCDAINYRATSENFTDQVDISYTNTTGWITNEGSKTTRSTGASGNSSKPWRGGRVFFSDPSTLVWIVVNLDLN